MRRAPYCDACGAFEVWRNCPKCGRGVCRDCMESHLCVNRSAHSRPAASAAERIDYAAVLLVKRGRP